MHRVQAHGIVYRQHLLMDGLKNTQQQTNKKTFHRIADKKAVK